MSKPKFYLEGVGRFKNELDMQIYIDILWNASPWQRIDIEMFDYLITKGFSYREASSIDVASMEGKVILKAMLYDKVMSKC